eukprot:XP_014775336.1 PREDICTED: trigger factor-like [Octopus bimaculoides]
METANAKSSQTIVLQKCDNRKVRALKHRRVKDGTENLRCTKIMQQKNDDEDNDDDDDHGDDDHGDDNHSDDDHSDDDHGDDDHGDDDHGNEDDGDEDDIGC